MSRKVLVAGIGNIFLSDDGFGVEVAIRLAKRALPAGVRVEDYGIRGVHLAYELLEGYEALVLVDAVDTQDAPGTITVLEPQLDEAQGHEDNPVVDAHSMSPDVVFGTLARLGGNVEKIFVIGCQPAVLCEGMGLSPAVEAAVDPAVELCCGVVARILRPVRKEVRR